MKRWTRNPNSAVGGILVLMFVGVIACGTALGNPSWTVTQLTNNNTDDEYPDISGANVVWSGWDGEDGLSDLGIYSNFAGKLASTGINWVSGADTARPAISGTNVVWTGFDGVQTQIYSNFGGVLGSGAYAAISGTNVVWTGSGAWSGHRIYSNFAGPLSPDDGLNSDDPSISGTNVVWARYVYNNVANPEIYSNFAGQLTSDATYHDEPAISGTNVVWVGWDGLNYTYQVYSNFAGKLSNDMWVNYHLSPDISGENVVWSGVDRYIYSNFAEKLTGNNSVNGNMFPAISGTNVAWQGWDGNDWEIYMATYGDAQVVPVPGAVLLGMLGLGAAGLKLRKYA